MTSLPPLSPREWQVLALLAQGLHNKAIAQQLCISENTAEKHLSHIYQKIGVTSRWEAGQWHGRMQSQAEK